MKRFIYSVLLISGLMVSCASAGPKELVSLDVDKMHPNITFNNAAIISNRANAIVVQTHGKENWPGISFKSGSNPWNLKGYYTVKVDLTNMGHAPAYLGLRLDGSAESKTPQHAQGFEQFDPGETRTLTVRLTAEPWVFRKPLELHGMRRAPGVALMNLSTINRIQVFAGRHPEPQTFIVSNLRAEGKVKVVDGSDFLPFIDTYGQYKHLDWRLKIHSDADFERIRRSEEKDLKAHPGPPDRGKYGGWTAGPQLESTGFFRVEKVNGKWWLIDPQGYLFWSTGPTCMSPDFGYTGIEHREDYFENLPPEEGPFGKFYTKSNWAPHGFYADKMPFKIFQFYKANLYRKYGEAWYAEFQNSAHNRLKSWGMNTIANWASPEAYLHDRTPYVANFFIEGCQPLEGSKGYWSKFHDVFDPCFRKAVRNQLATRTREAEDPWCIGFFVDNELSWGNETGLAVETLRSPAGQAAKQEFVSDLTAKYGKIEKLNESWGSNHASWEALLESTETPDLSRAQSDLREFYARTADTYFRTIKEELKKAAPNHLYLGCRFAWVNDIAVRAAVKHCDVVSFNKYNFSIRSLRLPDRIDRPIIIGEYHFGATDRGHFHPGLRAAEDQADRAEKFIAYQKSALENPQVVGVHWFQYVDEHVAGRADGENYNVGLVDICDTPYPEMVQAIRRVGADMYEYRMKQGD